MNTTSPIKQLLVRPVRGWRKRLFKAPLYLWRLGLGNFFGRWLAVLTTTGRVSGRPRHTVLEPIHIDGTIYLLSAWGKQAHWYKNVSADPYVTLQTGAGAIRGIARRVTEDAELIRLFWHMSKGNLFWEVYLEMWDISPTLPDLLAQKERLHILRIDPTETPAPSPIEADLRWMWGAVLASVFAANVVWKLVRRG